jgi:hypothetical protein
MPISRKRSGEFSRGISSIGRDSVNRERLFGNEWELADRPFVHGSEQVLLSIIDLIKVRLD